MPPFIPKYSVFRVNYYKDKPRYLAYNTIKEPSLDQKFITCTGTEIVSPLSKFRVENAGNDFVHIRSCYNNKYLRLSGENDTKISAAGDKPDENKKNWSCTLFKPKLVDGKLAQQFRFELVYNKKNVGISLKDSHDFLVTGDFTPDNEKPADVFTITNWDTLVILPKHVAFKGDNGKYLFYYGGKDDLLQFGSNDIGDANVPCEILTNSDGSICVKQKSIGKYWRDVRWINAIGDHPPEQYEDSKFWPINLTRYGEDKGNTIALKSLSRKTFLGRWTPRLDIIYFNLGKVDIINCLGAGVSSSTMEKVCYLEVEEPVVLRKVYDVDFRVDDAINYDEVIEVLSTDEIVNQSDTEIITSSLRLDREIKSTTSYKTSSSVGSETVSEFSSTIPILEGFLEIGSQKQSSFGSGKRYSWGDEKASSAKGYFNINVVVSPKKKVKIELAATKGFFEIPFSYTQRDTLTNGEYYTAFKEDGICSGSNFLGFEIEIREEEIES